MTGNPTKHASNHSADLAEKIETLLEPIEQILRGKKPVQYPGALRRQMHRMWKDLFLSETVDSYLVRPDETPSDDLTKAKGVTSVNPTPYELFARKHNIEAVAHKHELRNFKILGLDQHYAVRDDDDGTIDPVDMAHEADAMILTRSSLRGLREFLHMLRAKNEGDIRTARTRLIMQSTHKSFWSETIDYLGLDKLPEKMRESLDLHVTQFPGAIDSDSNESTIHALKGMGPRARREPAPSLFTAEIKPGDAVYICSGSPHKTPENSAILRSMQAVATVSALNSKVKKKPREAEEDQHSLEGNNLQKMMETREIILDDYDSNVELLAPKGKGAENTWMLFDDRGMEFVDARIPRTKAFKKAWPLFNQYEHKLMPGAELASVFKTFDRQQMFEQMVAGALKEIKDETGEDADPTIINTTCYVLVRMDWMKAAKPKYVSTFGKERSIALTSPKPLNADNIYVAEHYSAPMAFNDRHTPHEALRTKEEIPNYLLVGSEMSLAMRALGNIMNIAAHRNTLSHTFNISGSDEKLRIGTIHSLFPKIYGHGEGMGRVLKSALNGTYKLLNARESGYQYDVSPFIKPTGVDLDTRCGETHRDHVGAALARMTRFYRDIDGLILTPDNPKLLEVPGIEWFKGLMFYSMWVGKQVNNNMIETSFFGHFDEGGSSWKNCLRIFKHLSPTPLMMMTYDHFVKDASGRKDLKQLLREHKSTYMRPQIVEKGCELKAESVAADPSLFRVTIYSSASLGSETNAYAEALTFTENLASRSMAVIQGGGREGVMYATAEGVHRYIAKFKAAFGFEPKAHVTSEQSYETFEREGRWHEKTQFGRVNGTIEKRMSNLMNTDAEVVLAGGPGTHQEIFASLLMREWGLVPVADRPFIIVNQELNGRRVYDPVVAMLSPAKRAALNIHVVNNCDQAMLILEAARQSLAHKMEKGAIYIPPHAGNPLDRALATKSHPVNQPA